MIGRIKSFLERQGKRLQELRNEKQRVESFRETEEMKKAEEIKREADRLAQLRQYQTAIDEYGKALELYPYKGQESDIFKNASEFLFKCNYNIAACHSYLDNFDDSISYFDKALQIQMAEAENKVKALMGKGTCFYRKKLLVEGRYASGAYKISMDPEHEIKDEKLEDYAREDRKKNYIKLAHDCFAQACELDKNHVEAWYSRGHMEVLMNMIKEAVQSFDNVININKAYENKELIPLFDEIKTERGIAVNSSEIMEREMHGETIFKTKTGHLVKSRAEMMISNFLFDNNLLFQYNTVAAWADKDDFRASFYIPKLDLYIDHYPYDYVKQYQKSMRTKIKEYEKNKKKHIYITSQDEKNIEDSLKLKMKPYVIL